MKKLILVALCSTSFLSIARAEGAGSGMGKGDSMQHADAMKPDAQAPGPSAKQAKKQAKKQDDASKMKHGGMDHGAMKHGGADHGAMQHEGQTDGGTK